jgi:nucleoside-diphosphate-sugar epimerase
MRIAITGATGNVGTALLRRLAAEPDIEVLGIVRRLPQPGAGAPYEGVEWRSADLGDSGCVSSLVEWFTGVDAVVHLAWQVQPTRRPNRLRRTNVTGTRHVVRAMQEAGIRKLVYASSVGAYAPGPKDDRVNENWSTTGIGTSGYSVEKAAVEALLDGAEREHPELKVIRLRTALVFQRDAGAQLARYFLGRLAPLSVLRRRRLPVLPRNRRLRGQAVHADDAAEAYLCALRSDRVGAFNIAAEPVLDARLIAEELGGSTVPVPLSALRFMAKLAWDAGLVPTEPGWLDLTVSVPLVDCSRAEKELGWRPSRDARTAVRDLFSGIVAGAGTSSVPLRPGPRPAQRLRRRPARHEPA